MEDDQFVLVAVKGLQHIPIKEGIKAFVLSFRKQTKLKGHWKGWDLQFRSKAGYEAVPILTKKRK